MKNWIILNLLLLLFSSSSTAQDLPPCIKRLNKKTNLNTTTFERVIKLKGNRTVYQFAVKSAAQCMDCHNGTVFYDESCNEIASFLMGRGASAYVDHGYTADELGKAGYPNIKYGTPKDPVSSCIEKVLANKDSLERAGVSRIVQARIKGKILYGFEHWVRPKLANCKDCATPIVYYDADCKPEVTFRVGGIAGVKGEKGYTSSDYIWKTTIRIIWNSKEIRGKQLNDNKKEFKIPHLSRKYTVGSNRLKDFEIFNPGDQLVVSGAEGLQHYKNNKKINTYKIIPLMVKEHADTNSKPAAILSKEFEVFYIEPFKRYFRVVDNSFLVTKAKYLRSNALTSYNKADWIVAFNVK